VLWEYLLTATPVCSINHTGSAVAMETIRIFARSVEQNKLRYTYIGDGDTTAFREICNSNPYPTWSHYHQVNVLDMSKIMSCLRKIKQDYEITPKVDILKTHFFCMTSIIINILAIFILINSVSCRRRSHKIYLTSHKEMHSFAFVYEVE